MRLPAGYKTEWQCIPLMLVPPRPMPRDKYNNSWMPSRDDLAGRPEECYECFNKRVMPGHSETTMETPKAEFHRADWHESYSAFCPTCKELVGDVRFDHKPCPLTVKARCVRCGQFRRRGEKCYHGVRLEPCAKCGKPTPSFDKTLYPHTTNA